MVEYKHTVGLVNTKQNILMCERERILSAS